MRFEELMKVVGGEAEREELTRLGREYADAHRLTHERAGPQAAAQREAALGALMDKVQFHFRAIRHPLPTRQQLEEMLSEHFE
ncbi:MAG TPA: hypothetical protein VGB76_18980 [Pyrinomonadaceae bacterium]|jgi:hypothetical protein